MDQRKGKSKELSDSEDEGIQPSQAKRNRSNSGSSSSSRSWTPPPGTSKECTWPSAVMLGPIGTKPIDIPLKRQEAPPTKGKPSESILTQQLQGIWNKEPLEKTPSSQPINLSKRKDENQTQQAPPANFVRPPTPVATPHLEDLLRQKRPPIIHMRTPSLIMRLSFVLGMIFRQEIVMDSLTVPPSLDNPMYTPLKYIQQRRVQRKQISGPDERIHNLFRGFLFLPNMKKLNSQIVAKRHVSVLPEMEVAPYNDWMTTHPQFCPSCLTIHAFSYRKHPQSCIKLNTNGPRRLRDLSLSDIWKNDAQVLVVGHKNLMYQPPLLKNTFINISSSDMWDYAVPTSANAIFTNCVRHETSLIARINQVIQLVGPSCFKPILVEFYEHGGYPESHVALHLAGFAHAVRHCQESYMGPIVVVIPPVVPDDRDTPTTYITKKTKLSQIQNYGHLVGNALGVPIIHMPIQVTEYLATGESMHYHFWSPEPLFTSRGNVTREFQLRLHVWFDLFAKTIYQGIEKPNNPNMLLQ